MQLCHRTPNFARHPVISDIVGAAPLARASGLLEIGELQCGVIGPGNLGAVVAIGNAGIGAKFAVGADKLEAEPVRAGGKRARSRARSLFPGSSSRR